MVIADLQREQERLTIALVGRGGAGKSSLINRMAGRKVCEVGAFTDQTQQAEKHEWKQVVFVDLPGYGTRSFSLDRVMTEFNIRSFDMFLWCASDKFLAEDLTVYEALKATGKPLIFVRTKCDAIYDDEKTNEEVEAEITADLHRLIKERVELLFVSANPRYPGFGERLAKLIEAIEAHAIEAGRRKAEIVYRDFRAFTKEFLEKKRGAVENVVLQHAVLAAANGVNPIPGVNVAVDLGNVITMLHRVSTAYGIDEIAKAKVLGKPPTWLLAARNLLQMLPADAVLSLLRTAGGPVLLQQVGRYVPVFGMIISSGLGFVIVRHVGQQFLEESHQAAEEYLKASLQETTIIT
jgi:small GTP-binding protein